MPLWGWFLLVVVVVFVPLWVYDLRAKARGARRLGRGTMPPGMTTLPPLPPPEVQRGEIPGGPGSP